MACNSNDPNCKCEICCVAPTEIETGGTIKLATPQFFKDAGKGSALDGSFQARTNIPVIPIVTPDTYGGDAKVNEVINEINKVINNTAQTLGFPIIQSNRESIRVNYPALYDRAVAAPFTTVEIANFMNDAGYQTTDQAIVAVKKKPNAFMKLLNAFFALNLTALALNAICSVLQNPFGAIEGVLGTLEDIAKTLKSLPEQIKEFAEKAEEAIKELFENLKEKVENIAKGFEETLKGVMDLANNAAQAISKKFTEMVSDVKAFLGDINRDGIIETVKGVIAKAGESISEFFNSEGKEDKNIVDFLLFSFCKISKSLEDMINEPVNSLKNFADKFKGTFDSLAKESAQSTELAVAAGRLAAVPETIKQACDEFRTTQNSGVTERFNNKSSGAGGDLDDFGGTGPFVFAPQHTSHPDPKSWSNLRFNDSVINNSFWTTSRRVEMKDYYQTDKWDGDYIAVLPDPRFPKDIGYYGAKLELLEKANQLGQQLGLTFTINSAFRHPIYNQHLRNQGKGAAKFSQHTKGNALDIGYTSAGVNPGNRASVIKAFRGAGFGGIGIYSSFLHVDLGPVRSW